MGLFDIFTGKSSVLLRTSKHQWNDHEWIIDNILEDPSIRSDVKKWFSEKIIMAKVNEKVIGRDHDDGVREALLEQTNILLSRLTKIDQKIILRIQDVEGAQAGHPAPGMLPPLDSRALHELHSCLSRLQARMNEMKHFIDRQIACIPQRPAWQAWTKGFTGELEIPLRNLEAAAHQLRIFLDRH